MTEERKPPTDKLKLPPRVCANCGDPATMVLWMGERPGVSVGYPKCGACFGVAYKPRWEAARIDR